MMMEEECDANDSKTRFLSSLFPFPSLAFLRFLIDSSTSPPN